ncbi:MAG: hypothetical protein U0T77_00935 [Chitinophagales bacterium]
MRKIFLLNLFVCSFICSKSNEIARDYITGKVFKLNGDTITAKIHISYTQKNFVKELYIDNFGHYLDEQNKVRSLNADKINGFELMIDSTIQTFIVKNKTYKKNKVVEKRKFYHLLNNSNSTVRLYEFYNGEGVMPAAILGGIIGGLTALEFTSKQYLIEYNEGVLYHPSESDFKNDKLSYILSDYVELSEKIKNGTYLYKDIPLIIEEYNNWYRLR